MIRSREIYITTGAHMGNYAPNISPYGPIGALVVKWTSRLNSHVCLLVKLVGLLMCQVVFLFQ